MFILNNNLELYIKKAAKIKKKKIKTIVPQALEFCDESVVHSTIPAVK